MQRAWKKVPYEMYFENVKIQYGRLVEMYAIKLNRHTISKHKSIIRQF